MICKSASGHTSPLFDDVYCCTASTFEVWSNDVLGAELTAKLPVVGVDDVNDFVVTVDRQLIGFACVRQQSFATFHFVQFDLANFTEIYSGILHLIVSNNDGHRTFCGYMNLYCYRCTPCPEKFSQFSIYYFNKLCVYFHNFGSGTNHHHRIINIIIESSSSNHHHHHHHHHHHQHYHLFAQTA